MKRFLVVLACLTSIGLYAEDYTPKSGLMAEPSASIRSVNNPSYMSSGSSYSSDVYEVESSAPAHHGSSRRAGGPGSVDPGTPADQDPTNPQFSPIGDAVWPLLLMAMAYAAYVIVRRRRKLVAD